MKNGWPLVPAAIYLIGFLLIVLTYLIGMSFSAVADGATQFPSLQSFVRVLQLPQFREATLTTLVFVIIGTPLELVIGLGAALLVYQSYHLRGMVRSVLVIPIAIPALVTATLLFILFDYPGGHINHLLQGNYLDLPAIIDQPINWRGSRFFSLSVSMLGKVWRDTPISMLILLSGLNTIDPELYDASRTMGINAWRRLWHITLPLIIPSISTVVLLRSIEMWKEFIFPFILAGRYHLLGTLIESLYNDWGNSHEAAVVALLLVACIVISAMVLMSALDFLRRWTIRR